MIEYIFDLKIKGRYFNVEEQKWQEKTTTYHATDFKKLPDIVEKWEYVFDNNIELEIQNIEKDLPF